MSLAMFNVQFCLNKIIKSKMVKINLVIHTNVESFLLLCSWILCIAANVFRFRSVILKLNIKWDDVTQVSKSLVELFELWHAWDGQIIRHNVISDPEQSTSSISRYILKMGPFVSIVKANFQDSNRRMTFLVLETNFLTVQFVSG